MLQVAESFYTIQGEATHTGTPALFIRLQGCEVGCPWCDTKETWPKTGGATCTEESLVKLAVQEYKANHVVITGGEPCAQDIHSLTSMLAEAGIACQIETSGTYAIDVHPDTWVTVSPKYAMPGGRAVRQDAIDRADELKLVVGKESDIALALALGHANVWLQPLSTSDKATHLCVGACKLHGFRLSLQTHKWINIP